MDNTVLYVQQLQYTEWLKSNSDSEKSILLNKAMKSTTSRLLTFKKRKQYFVKSLLRPLRREN